MSPRTPSDAPFIPPAAPPTGPRSGGRRITLAQRIRGALSWRLLVAVVASAAVTAAVTVPMALDAMEARDDQRKAEELDRAGGSSTQTPSDGHDADSSDGFVDDGGDSDGGASEGDADSSGGDGSEG